MKLSKALSFLVRPLFALLLSIASLSVFAIDAPTNLRGAPIAAEQIKWEWDWVNGAKAFEVTVDGNSVHVTPNPHFTSTNLWPGEHSLRVRAIDHNNQYSSASHTIKAIATASGNSEATTVQQNNNVAANRAVVTNNSAAPAVPSGVQGHESQANVATWSWGAVPGATNYEVTVDGGVVGIVSGLQFVSQNLWNGEHSFTVKAINSANQFSAQSDTVKVVITGNATQASTPSASATQVSNTNNIQSNANLEIPANLHGEEVEPSVVKWEWDWTPGATQYEITVDGEQVGTTAETHHYSRNLWTGEHSLRLRAINAQSQYSQQSDTIKIIVTNSATTQSASLPPPPVAVDDNGLVDPVSWTIAEATNKPNYELVFSDEFNGRSLNPNRWNTQLRWDGEWNGERHEYRVINGESQFYVNSLSGDQGHIDTVVPKHNPFEFNGERLAIRAVRNPLKQWDSKASHGSLYEMVSQQDFLSGALSTYDKFTQKYGYFEARIKIPSHEGTFPAFWLHHQKRVYEGTHKSEIDIMENLGHAPWYVYNSFHYYDNVTSSYGGDPYFLKPYPEGQIRTGADFSQNYHVYAVEWDPNVITWYIDGKQVSRLENGNVNHEELYIILNLALGGNWTNYPTSSGGLGREPNDRWPTQNDINNFANPALEIDYVRAYKRR